MNTLIQKFAAHYECNLSLFGTLLVVAANKKQVKIKHFTTLPEKEQRQQLVLARDTLHLQERTKAVKIVVPPAVVVEPSDEAFSIFKEELVVPSFNQYDIQGTMIGDAAYH